MTVKVVDASAIAAVLFDEAEAHAVASRMAGASLAAPALLRFELASVCLKKCSRNPEELDGFTYAFAMRAQLAVDEIDVDHDGVVRLAVATGLSAYDASYLWLARHLGAELITLDRRLMAVAAEAPG